MAIIKPASVAINQLSRQHIASYINGFYNPVRRHSALGYLSPIDYGNRQSRTQAA